MTTQNLIDILKHCDPDAIVTDENGNEIELVDDLGDTVELIFE